MTNSPNSPDLDAMIASGKAVLDSLRGINTDWFNELIRVAMYQNHNLSVRGGSEKSSYFPMRSEQSSINFSPSFL